MSAHFEAALSAMPFARFERQWMQAREGQYA